MERSDNPFTGSLQRLMAAVFEQNVELLANQASLAAKLRATLENQSLLAAGLNMISEHLRETSPGFQGFVIDLQSGEDAPSQDRRGDPRRDDGIDPQSAYEPYEPEHSRNSSPRYHPRERLQYGRHSGEPGRTTFGRDEAASHPQRSRQPQRDERYSPYQSSRGSGFRR
jgi:hypothetical protein